MKKLLACLLCLMLMVSTLSVCLADSVYETIVTAGTTQAFTDEAVNEDDLATILQAGLAAPSAINQQPWYFVAVTNPDVIEQISGSGSAMPAGAMPAGASMPEGAPAGASMPEGGMPAAPAGGMPASSGSKAGLGDSPVAIIIYMNENTSSPNASFDCGLATQNMYITAASLGYGVKLVFSPTRTLNGADHDSICELLGVDTSMQAVAVLLIGRTAQDVDGATGATTRNDFNDKVSIIK